MARCRSCGQAYCRECVVEHDHRLVCAECLFREAGWARARTGRVPWLAVVQWVVAAGLVWLFFYGVAVALQRVPSEVHDGLIWEG